MSFATSALLPQRSHHRIRGGLNQYGAKRLRDMLLNVCKVSGEATWSPELASQSIIRLGAPQHDEEYQGVGWDSVPPH